MNTHRNLMKATFVQTNIDSTLIEETYRNLSSCLEQTNELISQLEDCQDRACLIILKDDFESLIEECEQYLFSSNMSDEKCSEDFNSRSETVIEELMYLLSNRNLH